ncbi:MAG: pyridoxal phosphate-dependent aminotransferase [Bacteriovoracaceae bacterium]|jgi:aspartate aminotransferase|nr:pyridoxal phosphate-dependent aminotransferase [Bacteriovoracaceae bacterium]
MESRGEKIISLNVGEPDLPPPSEITQAVKSALDDGMYRYSLVPGIDILREKLKDFYQDSFPVELNSSNFVVSNGAKQSIYNIFQSLINSGDEIIIPAPYWVTFPESVRLAGGNPIIVPTVDNQIDIELIKKAITKNTKAILINAPNNPSGAVFPKTALVELASIALENELYIISDEAYDGIYFDGKAPVSIGTLSPEIFKKTITIKSFSKTYSMTGFRVGYTICDSAFSQLMVKLQGHLTGNNCTFAQFGALKALELDQSFYQERRAIYQKRRDLAFSLSQKIFPNCVKPDGAFFLFPNIKELLNNSDCKSDIDLSIKILEKAGVAILPGSAFGQPDHLRISFAASEKEIEDGFRAIERVL